jgi:hypothetical protein
MLRREEEDHGVVSAFDRVRYLDAENLWRGGLVDGDAEIAAPMCEGVGRLLNVGVESLRKRALYDRRLGVG